MFWEDKNTPPVKISQIFKILPWILHKKSLVRAERFLFRPNNGATIANNSTVSILLSDSITDRAKLNFLMAHSHCTGTGTEQGTMGLYVMLYTVHTTPRQGQGTGTGLGTSGLHTHFPVPGPVQREWAIRTHREATSLLCSISLSLYGP